MGNLCKVDWGNTNLTKSSYVTDGKFLAVSASGPDGRIDHFEHEGYIPVLSAIGAQCGKMFFPTEKFTAIKNTITLTPLKNVVDGKYLYYLFTHIDLPQRGAGQPFISKGDIQSFKIVIPKEVKDQQGIVEKLDKAFAEIDSLEKNLKLKEEKTNQLLQSMLSAAFTNTEDIDTKIVNLGDICSLEYGKPLEKTFRTPDGQFSAYGANGPLSGSTKYLIEGPCIIVGRKGSAGEINYVHENVWPLDVTYYVKHDSEKTLLRYIYFALLSLDIKQLVRGVKPGLNRNDAYNLQIPICSISRQELIIDKLDKAFDEIDSLKNQISIEKERISSLRQSILSNALNFNEKAA